ncbi:MAG: hypothetical protein OQK76_00775 [Gammaproteobacteria bacterium]|nr:hypothetical protein [Gammaproteobacteria bacterium]MCW8909128.1 hypothetical protein [Gammaproteobacteria bacterium]MCW9006247.1 hypothetical protein [Gammaproteobacteria bacterium]MCW9055430.1 hypothetical protein [Gammaproteobacteria bacterium]
MRKDVQPFEYQILFNDKSVSELLCKSMGVQLPHSFGIIDPSDDCHSIIEDIFVSSGVNKLIIKPVLGHAGRGIILAIKNSTGIVIRTKEAECSLSDYVFKEKAIIQEVIIQDSEISKISNNSLNTIRVVSLLTNSNEVMILSSSMRFGSGNAFVDNWSAGGVAVGVDHKNGTLMEVAYDKHGNQYHKHPDTNVSFHNYQIPYWADVIEIAQIVQKSCSFYKLIGVDVAISTKGAVLIEINANPDIVFQEQTAGPLLKDSRTLAEFHKHDLLINKYQKNLLKNNVIF